ncbi:stage II sporulation protein D [Mobilitalea sibirica]|uniref:Stage II sporulation protein D n=1 Tax=Mobilitalea sibirica TaxID=1462919 RepID=A0A8J7KWX5_9FIRM|nr:stage II sporulation protein D [Mobilitalea sibirica]MBH1941037.1 stage II sporulation protein D [Mobilitalea sibirica]
MKKLVVKAILIGVIVLLFPFILTLMFSGEDNLSYSLSNMDFEVYYEKNGVKEKLEFDKYLIGVVAANMPAGYNLEALKAQSVIARTYALYNVSLLSEENPGQKSFTTSELGLSYISLSDMEQFWGSEDYLSYFTKLENAVYATGDQILVYESELILPVFFYTGSGYTRNASEAWGVDIPYLTSVSSKQDVTSINYLRITEYEIPEFMKLVQNAYTDITISQDRLFEDIQVTQRDSTGYVTKINLGSQTVNGEEFAKVIGLNSNHFYLEEYEGKVRVICTGVGHGIGLSQYGANSMANEGYTYNEILTHYYTGAKVVSLSKDN